MIQDAIKKVVEKIDLTFDESQAVMDEIMKGEVSPVMLSAYLVALRMKQETIDEIAGAALSMRNAAVPIRHGCKHLVDTCGTGGDGRGTFNISTAAAFIIAGAGYRVAKHGNKSVSSKCGSADVLQQLGINIHMPVEKIAKCLETVGIAFLFAPLLHGAMKHAMPVRKELGIRTIFNVLGPLTNPARITAQVMGVYDASLVEKIGQVIRRIGIKQAMVVHGQGTDEFVLSGSSKVSIIDGDSVTVQDIEPSDFGITKTAKADISGGGVVHNAGHIKNILDGKKGMRAEAALINAAAGILVASRDSADGRAKDLVSAYRIAGESIKSGAAKRKLEELARYTNE